MGGNSWEITKLIGPSDFQPAVRDRHRQFGRPECTELALLPPTDNGCATKTTCVIGKVSSIGNKPIVKAPTQASQDIASEAIAGVASPASFSTLKFASEGISPTISW
ncbi:MAG: hypothetical protein CBE00_07750 [Planctomycetaceae bacterium TMED240]|nr:hypothetical protein [Rhodopirellula sp.]OUX06409.1 MAG: hypothetical protein CBE00_07750 [Planctomycetaceae bacterium TMED240]